MIIDEVVNRDRLKNVQFKVKKKSLLRNLDNIRKMFGPK